MTGYNEILLASRLHNIDKFAGRAGEKSDQIFQLLKDCSFQNVNIDEIVRLAGAWRNPAQDDEKIISCASRLSAGTGRNDQNEQIQFKPEYSALVHIVSGLHLQEMPEHKKAYCRLLPMEGANIFACDKNKVSGQDYKNLWQDYIKDFRLLAAEKLEFDNFILSFDTLMERYTWCIPCSTAEDEDVSLYQHSKLTAAFAGALYKYHEANKNIPDNILDSKEEVFAFVQGDMSGIQKYIFDIKSHKSSAKLLRARSFQVWALSEIIAQYLTKQFGITQENIITTSGGKFLLLLPNIQSIKDMLAGLRLKIEKYFLDNFAGKITLVLSEPVCASGSEFKKENMQKLINKIGTCGERAKQEKMQAVLKENGHVLEELYQKLQNNENKVCDHCDIMPSDSSISDSQDNKCINCNDLINIGGELLKDYKIILNTGELASFSKMLALKEKTEKQFGYFTEYKAGSPLIPLPYEAPCEKNKIISFEKLADKSTGGNKKLAMFKADIDNLGLVFTSSWGKGDKNRISFSRYALLSRLLHYFFSAYTAEFISGNPDYKDKIYTVFSGGDDLCVLGAWDEVMRFAADFRKKLYAFTGENPSVTLSGGIVLSGHSLPVRAIAAMAEEALEAAKEYKNEESRTIKNAVSVFGVTVSWEEYESSLKDAEKIIQYLKEEKVNSSWVYKLIDFANRAQEVKKGRLRDMLWMSNYRYIVARNIKPVHKDVIDFFNNFGVSPEAMIKSRIAVSYALYINRKGKEE